MNLAVAVSYWPNRWSWLTIGMAKALVDLEALSEGVSAQAWALRLDELTSYGLSMMAG